MTSVKLLDEREVLGGLVAPPHLLRKFSLYEETLASNGYLSRPTTFHWNFPYYSYWSNSPRHPKFLNYLKNDYNSSDENLLKIATNTAIIVLRMTLETLSLMYPSAVVCAVPRSKVMSAYTEAQLLFYCALAGALYDVPGLENGVAVIRPWRTYRHDPNLVRFDNNVEVDFGCSVIKRCESTPPTHMSHKQGLGRVERGITKATCEINAEAIKGKTVILVDDIYTKTVNIDEDAIEALYEAGAERVIFYAVGKTARQEQPNTLY